jgi:hypothetical protein
MSEKMAFAGHFEDWRWRVDGNPVFYHFLTEDKLVFKRYMLGAGIPVAKLHATIGARGLGPAGESLATKHDVVKWLAANRMENLFIKPLLGSFGVGALSIGCILEDGRTWKRLPSGTLTAEEIATHVFGGSGHREFIVEERLESHPTLAELMPGVLHTMRVVTLLERDVKFVAASLRIGTGVVPVDNFAAGNLVSPIEMATGILGVARSNEGDPTERYCRHPVTGAKIQGRRLPRWGEAVRMVTDAALAFPFNVTVGWDVALTPDGPVMVEANDFWDPGQQAANDSGILRGELMRHLLNHGLLQMLGVGYFPKALAEKLSKETGRG